MDHQPHREHAHPEWARAKAIRQNTGISAAQLRRYAECGMIRTSHILRPGQTRGVRLYNTRDIEDLILKGIENQ